VLCLCGSLRRVSANRAALEAAQALAPASLRLAIYPGMGALPPFNPDVETGSLPQTVREMRVVVGRADALLIACPEYAHGIPGVFKNLLDWLVGALEFPGKPVLLLNTSARGAHHAQDGLMEVLKTMSARLLSSEPIPVRLAGAGCTTEAVLASEDRRCEIEVALGVLAAGLA
jgi:NAD(P)H-dependent FMN reductase